MNMFLFDIIMMIVKCYIINHVFALGTNFFPRWYS